MLSSVKYCSTVSVPMTGDSWWSSSWPAADTRWSAATCAGCSPLRRVILLPVSTCRYFYVCRYFSVYWVTMRVWPVWRTLISPLILLLIICPSLKGSKSSVGRTVGCSGLTMWQSWHLNCPHISRPRHGHTRHCQGAEVLLDSVRFVGRSFYLFGQPIDDSYGLINGFERNIFCPVFAQQQKLSWMFCESKFWANLDTL